MTIRIPKKKKKEKRSLTKSRSVMALYDALEAMDYGCSGGVMTFEAAKQAVDDSLSPCVLSKMNGDILNVSVACPCCDVDER